MNVAVRSDSVNIAVNPKKNIYHCFEHVYTQHMYTYCKILHIMNMYIFINKKNPLNIAVRSDSVNIAVRSDSMNIAVRSDSVNIAVNPKKKNHRLLLVPRPVLLRTSLLFLKQLDPGPDGVSILPSHPPSPELLLVVLLPYHLHDCRSCVSQRWHWRWRRRRRGHLPLGATLQ